MDAFPRPPRLTADLIRVAGRRLPPAEAADVPEEAGGGWRQDAKLFGFTWLAGFVFFLAYLS